MEKENVATAEAITTEASAKINNYSEIPQEERDFVHAGSIFQNDNDSIIAQKLWEFSQSCSDCYHLPLGMIEAVMIAVASTAIGTKIHVTSGVHDTNVSTWMCLVAPSGAGKTPLLNEIMSPLKSIQAQRYEEFKKLFDDFQALDSNKKSLTTPPVFLKTFVSDVTPEALYLDLSNNSNGLLMYRDELRGWIKDFGRYNSSGEIQNLLSIHSGDPICVSRKTSPPIFVEHPFLSILGGIQPRLLKKTFNEELIDCGFLGRFLFCFPKLNIITQMEDNVIPPIIRDFWRSTIDGLFHFPKPVSLKIEGGAMEVKAKFFTSNQMKMKESEEEGDAFGSAMYGKLINYADRLAGIIHTMRFFRRMPFPIDISADSYQKAINMISQFEQWGLKVRDTIAIPPRLPSQKEAIRLLDKVCPIINQSKFAEALGKKQQYISYILKNEMN